MKKVRWGILSTAKIGKKQVIPAMQQCTHASVEAICSRSDENAQRVAKELNIPKAYGTYEALLADPDVDAIYNPLPNHLHVPWSIKALEAGKHVLCEKPIGLSSHEAQNLIDAAKQYPECKIMEAFMFRHHPQWQEAKHIVDTGGIGDLVTIQSFFSYYNVDAGNIRNMADVGGGAMMDIGCYNISLSRFIFGTEPDRCCGFIDRDPKFKTDRLFSGMMDFGGKVSSFTCSTQLQPHQRVNILGNLGRVEIMIPFNAPNDEPCVLVHYQGNTERTTRLARCDQYTIQGDLMSKAILENTPVPTPLTDAKNNMHVLETLIQSADQATWLAC